MKKTWFAANFCPRDASCSEDEGALTPSFGPKIRTLAYKVPSSEFLVSTIAQFTDEQSFLQAGTNSQDWLKCDGKDLEINPYSALFSLVGTMYGGDGRSNFRIPDLTKENNSNGEFYIIYNGYAGRID